MTSVEALSLIAANVIVASMIAVPFIQMHKTAIRRRDERNADLIAALERCASIVDNNLYRQSEKIEDVPRIARAAIAKALGEG